MTWGIIYIVLAIAVWELIVHYFPKQRKDETDKLIDSAMIASHDETDVAEDTAKKEITTMDIVLQALRELQCTPVVEDGNNDSKSISFEFQAEHFVMRVDKSCFVTLLDTFWYGFNDHDIARISAVKRIINDINLMATVNLCYTHDVENNTFNVHTVYSMVCLEGNDFTGYLRNLLHEYFVVHYHFFRELAEAKLSGAE